ncbi:DNA-binding protein [Bacillus sp. 7504-2]|nr:DNA-binding protein [Bacillus sp. 7504-2]
MVKVNRDDDELCELLKEMLEERSWSLRKLSERTVIDKATISKILNGKRKANLNHLQRFADCFEVPLHKLLKAAGYEVEKKDSKVFSEYHAFLKTMKPFFEENQLPKKNLTVEDIQQELAKYEQFAQTKEGEKTIVNGFAEKLKKVDSIGSAINHLKDFYEKFRLKKGSVKELSLMGGALLYFILTIDYIPDYLFPIGYVDDAIAVQVVVTILKK